MRTKTEVHRVRLQFPSMKYTDEESSSEKFVTKIMLYLQATRYIFGD